MKRYYENSQADLVRKSKALVVNIYNAVNSFAAIDDISLGQAMAKSAVSIPGNIAECESGLSGMKTITHLNFAYVSLRELAAKLSIAKRLEFISERMWAELARTIDQLIEGVGASCSVACVE